MGAQPLDLCLQSCNLEPKIAQRETGLLTWAVGLEVCLGGQGSGREVEGTALGTDCSGPEGPSGSGVETLGVSTFVIWPFGKDLVGWT